MKIGNIFKLREGAIKNKNMARFLSTQVSNIKIPFSSSKGYSSFPNLGPQC